MKIVTHPSVYLLSKQTVQPDELDRFLSDHGFRWESDGTSAAEVVAETAGRLCYLSYPSPRPGGNAAYIGHIVESGHGSVLEHAVWTLILTGVSRSLSHELIRHRAGVSPSQLSQRYVDESVAEYVEPDIIAADPELHAVWVEAMAHAHAAYVKLADGIAAKLTNTFAACDNADCEGGWQGTEKAKGHFIVCRTCKGSPAKAFFPAPLGRFLPGYYEGEATGTDRRKCARQAARSVLPNATETKLALTLNARAARNVFEQRGSGHADPEIRKLANAVFDVLTADSPALFSDYRKRPLSDGTFEITTDHRKV